MKSLAECYLYAFVDAAYLHQRDPGWLAEQLCQGGADLIQLRAKNYPLEQIRHMAEAILRVTRGAGVGLVINDHLSLANELGAEFCHLGQEDFFEHGFTHITQLPVASTAPGIGLSTHAPEQARRALDAGAHYVAIGPVFPTGTKPSAKPVTLDYVRWAAENIAIPWFAIGGINLENVGSVLEAGAKRVCVVSAILNSSDPAKTCRQFKERLIG
jgi:thiamine-phosphate pyrophosphorylase